MFGAQKSHLVAVIYDYFMFLLCFDFSNICRLNSIQPGIVNSPMCCTDVCRSANQTSVKGLRPARSSSSQHRGTTTLAFLLCSLTDSSTLYHRPYHF